MKENHIGVAFLKGSTYASMPETEQQKGKKQPPLEMPYQGVALSLPTIDHILVPEMSLKEAIIQRQSHRQYKNEAITLDELAYALYMTQGVKKMRDDLATFRTVPSAGARHPFETFLVVNNVIGLKSGIYRYLALSHELLLIEESDTIAESLTKACLGQKMVKQAAVTFLWVADSYRTTYRYGMRGYRYMFLDAGHVCQNLYLVAEQMRMGTCAIAAYDDDQVNELFGFDGKNQFVIYIAPLGRR
jgi:SagB-type dehydrogenase family enzyme